MTVVRGRRLMSLALVVAALTTGATLADPTEEASDLVVRDADYAAGKQAIENKNWAEAAKRFQMASVRQPDNADIENYLGYAHRNLKQFDAAFKHYKQALVLNPRHRGAHKNIGKAFLMVKDLPSGEKNFAALRKICLLPCKELTDLKKPVPPSPLKNAPK